MPIFKWHKFNRQFKRVLTKVWRQVFFQYFPKPCQKFLIQNMRTVIIKWLRTDTIDSSMFEKMAIYMQNWLRACEVNGICVHTIFIARVVFIEKIAYSVTYLKAIYDDVIVTNFFQVDFGSEVLSKGFFKYWKIHW